MNDEIENIGIFDLDGSMAGYDESMIECLNLLRHPDEPEITDLRSLKKVPYIHERMKLIKSQPGWWANLPLLPNGQKILETAKLYGFDCRILTKGPKSHSNAWKEKLDWVFEKLGDMEVTITFDKGSVYGKFLYDDYIDYCLRWLQHRPRGLVIMPVKKITGEYEAQHPNIIEYDGSNFTQVRSALWLCLNRLPSEPLVVPR